MTVFVLKIIACITMLLDHIKYGLPETSGILTLYFGRIAFPIFAFLAVEGYVHTSNFNKYLKRLLIFGIISQIPFMLFKTLMTNQISLNIMFTLLLGVSAIFFYEKIKNKFLGLFVAILMMIIGQVMQVDYGWYGVGLVFIIYLIKNNKITFTIFYILYTLLYYFVNYIKLEFNTINLYLPYIIFSIIPIILMLLYNGKLGRKTKYFYYWFYPIHLLIIYIIPKFI